MQDAVCMIESTAMETKEERTSLILHGHFYQPPRENPFTGCLPKQDSAAPYLDWNERIYKDCYSANAHSRYLSPEGRIISITNNFSYISFNFGPTLLSWIQKEHPMMLELLKEADKASIERLGHGNAMAQAFNHTILPLDRYDDARLQIEWGARDFENRFSRRPEGMWLPEAGINGNVIDLLAEEGIKEGENLTVYYENANADGATGTQIINNFQSKKTDLICAIATPMAQSAYSLTKNTDIPVIYTAVTDPVMAKLATEDKKPVGEVTGTSDKLPVEQQLQMIRQMLPEAKTPAQLLLLFMQ